MSIFTDRLAATNHIINSLDQTEIYSIGIHKNFHNRFHEGQTGGEFCNSVLTNGLTMNRGERAGLTDTVYMQGSTDFYNKISNCLEELFTATENEVIYGGVIVAIPGSIKDLEGTEYYLGLYPDNLDFVSKYNRVLSYLPIENYTEIIEKVPKEFILCTVAKIEGKTTVVANDRYFSRLSPEEQAKMLDDIRDKNVTIQTVEESKHYLPLPAWGDGYNVPAKYLADSAAEYEARHQELLDFYGVETGPRL